MEEWEDYPTAHNKIVTIAYIVYGYPLPQTFKVIIYKYYEK